MLYYKNNNQWYPCEVPVQYYNVWQSNTETDEPNLTERDKLHLKIESLKCEIANYEKQLKELLDDDSL